MEVNPYPHTRHWFAKAITSVSLGLQFNLGLGRHSYLLDFALISSQNANDQSLPVRAYA